MSIKNLNDIAHELFGVTYHQLGLFGKWEVEDEYYKRKQNEDNRQTNDNQRGQHGVNGKV